MGLDFVELIMEIEHTFDVTISDAQAGQSVTVGQLYDVIRAQIVVRDPTIPPGYTGPPWELYLTIIAEELGVPRDVLTPSTHFVKDLGAD